MSFENKTNQNRVKKMEEILCHLSASAESNTATPEQIAAMLAPIIAGIESMCSGQPLEPVEPVKGTEIKPPSYMKIREAAQTASLQDLTYAMAVYLTRIDEHLDGIKPI